MSRLQFLTALSLGCGLLITSCAGPELQPSPSTSAVWEPIDPVPSPHPVPSQPDPINSGPKAPTSEAAAQLAIDLTGPIPAATNNQDVMISGSFVTGATITAHLEPEQKMVLRIVGAGPVTTETQLDNSIPVLVSGEFEFGLGPPHAVNDLGEDTTFDFDVSQDGKELTYTLSLPVGSLPAVVTIPVGSEAATAAVWTSAEGGESLQVSPSDWGRTGGMTVVEFGWPSVVVLQTDTDSSSMRNQFQCHAIGAPTKTHWNLEPWRADVGLLAFMAKRCNP